jgi:hypothetical protein
MAKPKLDYRPYPDGCISQRSGAKVGWRTYATRPEAEKCAKAARHNAAIKESLGYDFGYQAPGEIRETKRGFEVTLP